MEYAVIISTIGAIGTVSTVAINMRNILKSNELRDQEQVKFNTEMKKDIQYIKTNQESLNKKIEETNSVQIKNSKDIATLEERLKSTNTRVDNLEKEFKRK